MKKVCTWGRRRRAGRAGAPPVLLRWSGEGLGGASSSVASSLVKWFLPSELCWSQLRFLETVMVLSGGLHPDVSVAPSRPLAQDGGWMFSMRAGTWQKVIVSINLKVSFVWI